MCSPIVENDLTLLFTKNFLQSVKLLGNDSIKTISTALLQNFISISPDHLYMQEEKAGILCFIKDYSRKNYYFRLYGLESKCVVWEDKFYSNMEYIESSPFVHLYQGEGYIVAFNFANQSEAKTFKLVVDQKILIKRTKEEKKARQISQSHSIRVPQQPNSEFTKQELRTEKIKRNITNTDIGTPMDFIHILHIGWNPDTGFDVLIEDDQLKALLQKAEVSEKQLQDKETRDFIYEFIKKHGGIDSALASERDPPVVPPRGSTRPPSARLAPPSPPLVTILPGQGNPVVAFSFASLSDAEKFRAAVDQKILGKNKTSKAQQFTRSQSMRATRPQVEEISKPTNVKWTNSIKKSDIDAEKFRAAVDQKILGKNKTSKAQQFTRSQSMRATRPQVEEISKPANVKRTNGIKKSDIGNPTNLTQTAHIGIEDLNKLIDTNKDNKIEPLLKKAEEVSQNKLEDKKIIYAEIDFALANKEHPPSMPPKALPRNKNVKMDLAFATKEDPPILPPRGAVPKLTPTPSVRLLKKKFE